ncbi:Hypothetical predicted protein [Cloeon dipterum]|uniref:Uncharacterized protein n=1 Tax=Cloeon dipterum TaxID=197152 RepID=A0A8S1DD84_9INSE|nr:Hypothetical predicted protein [Cloeon dipterum]
MSYNVGNLAEIKTTIRKFEFPYCARDALEHSEALLMPYLAANPNDDVPQFARDFVREVASEFVFCDVDPLYPLSGVKRRVGLKSSSELSLLEVLCDHFSKTSQSNICAGRNQLFLVLFHPITDSRMKILSKLASLAISTRKIHVLLTIGYWMHWTLPISPDASLHLAQSLVSDFFILTPSAAPKLQELPQVSPLFTASLLTSLVQMYGSKPGKLYKAPPQALLKMVTQWVQENTHLCLAPLQQPKSGPTGINEFPATPIIGLFRWTIFSPFHDGRVEITESATELNTEPSPTLTEMEKLYSTLHLSLMQGLLIGTHAVNQVIQGRGVSVIELASLADDLRKELFSPNVNEPSRNLALDRFGQAVQSVISAGCVSGNKNSFMVQLSTLPETRLLRILKSHNRIV